MDDGKKLQIFIPLPAIVLIFGWFSFQSARTALELIEKAKKAGEKLPEESRFDSNCITPGTAFMVRLQEALKHFVKMKMSTDPSWRHCRFILSGHEVCCLFRRKKL